jgi:hypothetical protein
MSPSAATCRSRTQTGVEYGLKVFGTGSSNMPIKWTDADFFSNSVGYGNLSPDEHELGEKGNEIFQTAKPISVQECEGRFREAKGERFSRTKEGQLIPGKQPTNQ